MCFMAFKNIFNTILPLGSSNHGTSNKSNTSLPPPSNLVTPSPSHPPKPLSETSSRVSLAVRAYESFNTRVQSLGVRVPRRAWTEESDDDGGFLARTIPRLRPSAPSSESRSNHSRRSPVDLSCPPAKFSFVDDSASEKGSERASSEPPSQTATLQIHSPSPQPSPSLPPPTASVTPPEDVEDASSQISGSSVGLVIITMLPDTLGRFGFNVKGGNDQGVPVIVSRVAGGTPADTCIPRLTEGDQVVMINGRDISALTHDQVIIRL